MRRSQNVSSSHGVKRRGRNAEDWPLCGKNRLSAARQPIPMQPPPSSTLNPPHTHTHAHAHAHIVSVDDESCLSAHHRRRLPSHRQHGCKAAVRQRSVPCRRHAAQRYWSRRRESDVDDAHRRHSRARVRADEGAESWRSAADQARDVSCQPPGPGRAGRAFHFRGTVRGHHGSGQEGFRLPYSALQDNFAHVRSATEEAD